MSFVYVLKHQISGKLYVGSCDNLDRRLSEHRRTKPQYQLVYSESRPDKRIALKREAYLKSGNGRRALKNLCALERE
jgi:predicted GIY-YIG superfamily endonuclease